ncbi:HEAT repeat domain-containing protein [Archangium lipolyticum]|uniref:HEAT repeat domain-containing protein n=1 Tax=Archangium lipolyticum TaxID=2970465 RepID=UPI002149B451|nr:HEAT repeat domain-containing protein [Archangium lipolyticum]
MLEAVLSNTDPTGLQPVPREELPDLTKTDGLGQEARHAALDALSGGDQRAIVDAARLLSSGRGMAVPLLRKLKTEPRAVNRQAILYAISWQDDIRAWWPLLKVLADVDEAPAVRGQAAEGIGYLFWRKSRSKRGYLIAKDVLLWALNDPSPEVRYYAIFALGASRDHSVIAALQGMTKDSGRSNAIVGTVGEEARRAIAWIQD